MSASLVRSLGLLIAGIIVFGTGFWLSRAGRPYGTALLTVHKLVDLGVLVAIGLMAYRASRASAPSALEWVVVAFAVVAVIAAFASGAVASASDPVPKWALVLHKVAPWLAGGLTALVAYFSAVRA
jgi:hypothetical protein